MSLHVYGVANRVWKKTKNDRNMPTYLNNNSMTPAMNDGMNDILIE
jgi:hypothetical protein